MDELRERILVNDFHVIAVTETWAREDVIDSELSIDGYVLYRKDRQSVEHCKGGGVMILVKSSLKSKPLAKLNDMKFQDSVWCQIELNQSKLIVGVCYRSTASSPENNAELVKVIEQATRVSLGTRIMILGDFNYPEVDYRTTDNGSGPGVCSDASEFLQTVIDAGLHQHVHEFTRYRTGQTPSLLDYVFTDDEYEIDKLNYTTPLGKSDHVCIEFGYLTDYCIKSSSHQKLDYWKADYGSIKKELAAVDWDADLQNRTVTESWQVFQKKLMSLCDKYVPIRKNNASKRKNNWITKTTITEIKKREKAWIHYKKTESSTHYRAYKSIRNRVTRLIRKDKEDYQKRLISRFRDNPKRFYGYMRRMRAVKTVVSNLDLKNGSQTESDGETAEELCRYFSEVFVKEGSWQEDKDVNITSANLSISVTEAAVHKALNKLKSDKSPGPDNIHPKLLHEVAAEVVRPLTLIFQKSVSEGKLPSDWKKANITPIYKKGSRNEAGNYRPVSLTSVVCKLLESIIRDQILDYLNQTVVTTAQHGFVQGRSCLTNLLEVLEHWTSSMDQGYGVDVIYLDYRKAFDTVPHQRLLTKLKMVGITGDLLEWIRDFLYNRMMRVIVNGECSTWSQVWSGIPQGSVLGPLLFLIFVNDLPDWITSNIGMFADDTKIWTQIVSKEDSGKLQEDLDNLSKWSEKWLLQFNPEKCVVMHIGHNVDTHYYIQQEAKKWELQSVTEEKDLGVVISNDLKVSRQCSHAAGKASKVLGMIRRQFKNLDKPSFLILYKGFIRPHLEYAIQAWSPYLKKDIEHLEKVQRKATKLVKGFSSLSYEERLKVLKLTSLEKRRLRGDLIETYKLVTGKEKIDFTNLLQLDVSGYNTRGHKFKLKKHRSRLDIRKNFFSNRVVQQWNSLPAHVVEAESVITFKKRLDNCSEWGI